MKDLDAVVDGLEKGRFSVMKQVDGGVKALDPTGFGFLLLQGAREDPIASVALRVADLSRSIT